MSCHIVYTLKAMIASSLDKINSVRSRIRYKMKNLSLSACQIVSCFWLLLISSTFFMFTSLGSCVLFGQSLIKRDGPWALAMTLYYPSL